MHRKQNNKAAVHYNYEHSVRWYNICSPLAFSTSGLHFYLISRDSNLKLQHTTGPHLTKSKACPTTKNTYDHLYKLVILNKNQIIIKVKFFFFKTFQSFRRVKMQVIKTTPFTSKLRLKFSLKLYGSKLEETLSARTIPKI